jgi:hypothetical protein
MEPSRRGHVILTRSRCRLIAHISARHCQQSVQRLLGRSPSLPCNRAKKFDFQNGASETASTQVHKDVRRPSSERLFRWSWTRLKKRRLPAERSSYCLQFGITLITEPTNGHRQESPKAKVLQVSAGRRGGRQREGRFGGEVVSSAGAFAAVDDRGQAQRKAQTEGRGQAAHHDDDRNAHNSLSAILALGNPASLSF